VLRNLSHGIKLNTEGTVTVQCSPPLQRSSTLSFTLIVIVPGVSVHCISHIVLAIFFVTQLPSYPHFKPVPPTHSFTWRHRSRYGTVSSPPSSPSRPPDPDHAGTHRTQRRSAPPSVRSSHATKDRRLFPQTWKTKHQSTHYGQRERKKYPCTIESCRQYPDGGCGQRNTHKTRRNK
jgi:hypothetical protein